MSKDAPSTPAVAAETAIPPLDLHTPQLTLRAVLTGMLLGGLLSVCNIYSGLTIGWGLNMSITSAILAYGFWHTAHSIFGSRPWSLLENNINQTAASAAAMVSSAGLVAGIPALTLLDGTQLGYIHLALWIFSICLVGIVVGVGMRKQLIVKEKLPFPTGIASATTLREIHAQGAEALRKVAALLVAAVVAASMFSLKQLAILASWAPKVMIGGFPVKSLTFSLNPSMLMYGVGIIVGIRTATWLLLGSILAWLVIAPPLIHKNYIRLTVSEPLPSLPAGVVLPPEPEGFARYNADKKQLEWKGQMSMAERDALLEKSTDVRFRESVLRMYLRSQRALTAPLASLPGGVDLAGKPVKYLPEQRALRAVRGLTETDRAELHNLSDDPDWRAALDALYRLFEYETTRGLVISSDAPRMPPWFGVPPQWTGYIRYERLKNRLTVHGKLPDEALRDTLALLEEDARLHPSAAELLEQFRQIIIELHRRSAVPLMELENDAPVMLTPSVRYDPNQQTLTARGILTAAHEKELAESLNNPVLAASAAELRRATDFTASQANFADVVAWLLWPGVALMVVSSLVSFAFSWRSILRTFQKRKPSDAAEQEESDVPAEHLVSNRIWLIGTVIAMALSIALQMAYFGISWWTAVIGLFFTFILALVAGRVAGETNTVPVGAMGKVTQLVFGAIAPQQPAPNLMAATVTGGAASACSDLLFDMKTGRLVGASPKFQAIAQVCGALAGALMGTAGYMILLPNPRDQLFTEPYTAPAVTTWKAVAELFMIGFSAIPEGTPLAILIASGFGVLLPILDKVLPKKAAMFVPSPAAVGLSFVIMGDVAVAMFLGAVVALLASKAFPKWSSRFLITIAAGFVAGDSLSGAGSSLYEFTKLL